MPIRIGRAYGPVMRKTTLPLSKETIRQLTGRHLRGARGGEPPTGNCDTGHSSHWPDACATDACVSDFCASRIGPCV